MAAKTKAAEAAGRETAPPAEVTGVSLDGPTVRAVSVDDTRVVLPGVLVCVRANPWFFRGYSAFPWLVKEIENRPVALTDEEMNTGWAEAKNLTIGGPVACVAEEYAGKTWQCGVQVRSTNRAVMLTTEAGVEYTPGEAFTPPQ